MNRLLAAGLAAFAVAACTDTTAPPEPAPDLQPGAEDPSLFGFHSAQGAVYLMSNAAGPNEVLVYDRAPDGSLMAREPVATGGLGTGTGLGNQGALATTAAGRVLLVVNPGSDDVSVFAVARDGLHLLDRVASGGSLPISVTAHRDVVYVLNAGVPNGIQGFRLNRHGELEPIPGSAQPLSQDDAGPAQIGFSPDGRALVVTEKATNRITTYAVDRRGVASGPRVHDSAGATPFGFAFNVWGALVVSEAQGGAPDASTVSLYRLDRHAGLHLLEGEVPTTETAACWIAIPAGGAFAYTTNTGSGSVTGYRIGVRHGLTILDDDGETGLTGEGSMPIDADFSIGGRFLYVLSSGTHEVSAFRRGAHGRLTAIPGATGLPATANGMIAR